MALQADGIGHHIAASNLNGSIDGCSRAATGRTESSHSARIGEQLVDLELTGDMRHRGIDGDLGLGVEVDVLLRVVDKRLFALTRRMWPGTLKCAIHDTGDEPSFAYRATMMSSQLRLFRIG